MGVLKFLKENFWPLNSTERPLNSKLVFTVSYWWYNIERWTKIRMLVRTLSPFSKRISGMKSEQKYSIISTWPQRIPIYDLPPLEKDWKREQAGYLVSSCFQWVVLNMWLSIFFSLKTEKLPISQWYYFRWQKCVFYDNFQRKWLLIDKDGSLQSTLETGLHGRKDMLRI